MIRNGSVRFIGGKLSNGGRQRSRKRAKDVAAVAGPKQVLTSALRVRHQTQNVAFAVTNSGNVVTRAIRIGGVSDRAVLFAITKYDAVLALQFGDRRVVADVVAFGVRDRNAQHGTGRHFVGERTVR